MDTILYVSTNLMKFAVIIFIKFIDKSHEICSGIFFMFVTNLMKFALIIFIMGITTSVLKFARIIFIMGITKSVMKFDVMWWWWRR